ncbi:cell adhesion molecule CEACAM5 [Misgurnus anguillicaudatus]|uniref:cell adhesion molecule CEACAM5 n=1 Tax=Misgurnus anguillicaudatus TaxID=75329 RepID=UPI003CCF9A3C
MDRYHFRLHLLFLAIFGCCDGSMLLSNTANGVVGKNVTFLTTITSSSSFLTITWGFDVKGKITSIITVVPTKETIDPKYANRIAYNKSTCALQIKDLVMADAGDYILSVVNNEAQSTAEQITLEVLEPVTDVKITANLPDAVEFNSTMVLTCSAKGSYTYKWINGSTPLVADGTHVTVVKNELTVTGVYRTDLIGPIYCIAENALESGKSAPFNMSVSYGPENIALSQTPADPFLKKGSNITFACSAKSDPPAQLQLMFNGVEISKQASTTITNLEDKHNGNYTCVASNPKTLRFIASQVYTITVVEPISGTSISINPTSPLIAGNSMVNLTCTAAAGKADSVEWYKEEKPVIPDSNVILSSDKRTLTVLKVRKTDAGEYKCKLTNKVNSDTGKNKVVVNYGPESVKVDGKNNVKFDEAIGLSCNADSVPPSTYTWKLNETVMNISLGRYNISKASMSDSGTYTCVARNPLTGLTLNTTHKLTVTETGASADGLSGGAIAGIVIGVLLAAIIIGCICCCRKKPTDVPSPY